MLGLLFHDGIPCVKMKQEANPTDALARADLFVLFKERLAARGIGFCFGLATSSLRQGSGFLSMTLSKPDLTIAFDDGTRRLTLPHE